MCTATSTPMRRLLCLAFTVLGLATASAAHAADRIALLPVAGVNIHEGYAAAAQSLTRDALQGNGFEVVAIPGAGGTQEATPQVAMGLAQSNGARFAIVMQVTRLSSLAKVKLAAYDAATGQMVYVASLSAGTPDDLDKVITRLVAGFATGKPPTETAEIDTVTQQEADPYLKQKATQVFGVRMSVVAPLNRPDGSDEGGLPGLGIFWLYDVRAFLADVSLDFHSKENEGDFTVALGAYYPFSRSNTTLYLGGGIRYGAADYGNESQSGIGGFGGAGVLFGRLSTVQLRGEVMYFQNLFSSTNNEGSDGVHTGGIMASAGIGF